MGLLDFLKDALASIDNPKPGKTPQSGIGGFTSRPVEQNPVRQAPRPALPMRQRLPYMQDQSLRPLEAAGDSADAFQPLYPQPTQTPSLQGGWGSPLQRNYDPQQDQYRFQHF